MPQSCLNLTTIFKLKQPEKIEPEKTLVEESHRVLPASKLERMRQFHQKQHPDTLEDGEINSDNEVWNINFFNFHQLLLHSNKQTNKAKYIVSFLQEFVPTLANLPEQIDLMKDNMGIELQSKQTSNCLPVTMTNTKIYPLWWYIWTIFFLFNSNSSWRKNGFCPAQHLGHVE